GAERLVPHAPVGFLGERFLEGKGKWAEFLEKTPLSEPARRDILRIEEGKADPMSGSSQAEKKERLTKISYKDFLLNVWKTSPDVIPFYQTSTHGLYGIGIDAVPALDCWALHYPGFQGMNLDRVPTKGLTFTALGEVTPQDEYFFHFPDGNASVASLLVHERDGRQSRRGRCNRKARLFAAGQGGRARSHQAEQHGCARAACGPARFRERSFGRLQPERRGEGCPRQAGGTGLLEHDDS